MSIREIAIADLHNTAVVVGLQHETRQNAVAAEQEAARLLFNEVLVAIEPAMAALCSPLVIAQSREGCGAHEVMAGNHNGKILGFDLHIGVAIGEHGEIYKDTMGNKCPRCFRYDWVKLDTAEVLKYMPIGTLVAGIADCIDEQIAGGKMKQARAILARAKKLRAVADLLHSEVE